MKLFFNSLLTWAMKYANPYVGATWEHEFDGQAAASVHGIALDEPSMKGDTGIGEIGITLVETVSKNIGLDLGLQGYTGEKEGIVGTARLSFNW